MVSLVLSLLLLLDRPFLESEARMRISSVPSGRGLDGTILEAFAAANQVH